MASVDDRIVKMSFTNQAFEAAAAKTLGTLDKLKHGLDFKSSSKGLGELQSTASHFNLNPVSATIDGVSKRFLALGTIGVTAINNITNRAINAGINMTKALTINPLKDGFQQYEKQINATQTILANTAASGGTLKSVTATLSTLNDYANKTIYNFSDMATNLGTFTSAGIKLGPASEAIQGISNVAAAAGAGTQQAAGAMYQLSQALGRGKVTAQDWNSVVAAGMASSNFKNALLETGKAMGTIKMPKTETIDQWVKAGGSFQDAMSKGQITSGVLIQTLQAMTGNMTDAQLAAKGYTAEQIKSIQAMAKQARDSAVNIKTVTALIDNLQQGVGSAWAAVFKTIFGDLPTATKMLTKISGVLNHMFVDPINNFNVFLKQWVKLGGLKKIIQGFIFIFKDVKRVFQAVRDAFRDIFPPATVGGFVRFAQRFEDFFHSLYPGVRTVNDLRRTFDGIFALFDIGKQVVSAIFQAFGKLLGALGSNSKGFLHFTGNVGAFITNLDIALKKGGLLTTFFGKLADILIIPIRLLGIVKDYIASLFSGFHTGDGKSFTDRIDSINASLAKVDIQGAAKKLGDEIHNLWQKLKEKFKPITDIFSGLGKALKNSVKNADFGDVLSLIQTGLLGGLFLLFRKFFKNLGDALTAPKGIIKSIRDVLGGLTGTLQAMQEKLKSEALLNIAKAVSLIAVAVIALSRINAKKMHTAFVGLTAGFIELLAAMAVVAHTIHYIRLPFIVASMIGMATAIDILTLAVVALAHVKPEQLAKGVTGVAGILTTLSIATHTLSKNPFLLTTGVALILIATALDTLTVAITALSLISWETLGRGLTGVAGALVAIGIGVKALPYLKLIPVGIGLNLIATALVVMSTAILLLSRLSWENLGKGLAAVAAALVAVAIGVKALPIISLIPIGIGLTGIAFALNTMALALFSMSRLSWESMGKGLAGIGATLVILAEALRLMRGALLGAVALGVAAGAMFLLAQAIKTLGKLGLKQVIIGIGGLAAIIAVLGVAAAVLTPVTTAMLFLGAGIAAIGGGIALLGFGFTLIATAIAQFAKTGAEGVKIVGEFFLQIVEFIPKALKALAVGFFEILKVIYNNTPALVKGIGAILEAIMQAIIDKLPKALELFTDLIDTLLEAVVTEGPKVIDAGLNLIITLLRKLASKTPDIIKAGADFVIALVKGLADNIGRIVDAGFNLIVKFLNGIADGIKAHLPEILKAVGHIGAAIVEGLWNGIVSFLGWLWKKLSGFVSSIINKIADFLGIASPAKAMYRIGKAIVEGIWEGIKGAAKWLWNKLSGFVDSIISFLGNALKEVGDFLNNPFGSIDYKKIINDAKNAGLGPSGTGSKPTAPTQVGENGGSGQTSNTGGENGGGGTKTLAVTASTSTARTIAASTDSVVKVEAVTNTTNVNLVQNNTSPKALSTLDIYRSTNNQLATAKQLVGVPS